MHPVLNHVAGRVMNGRRLAAGDFLEGMLGGVPVLVEELNEVGLDQTAMWSHWFHRRPVRALQLVWPDTSARFAWQPGASAALRALQPSEWRQPLSYVGAFAPDPTWTFFVPADLKVVACKHVLHGAAIGFVERRTGYSKPEDWYVHCDKPHGGAEDYALCHFSHLVRATPSLREVGDLKLDEYIWREHSDQPWRRSSKGELHPLMKQEKREEQEE